jgi:Na+-translocating ferredoxin:NAD+ oxidoreductase RnfG subunit
MSGLRWLTAAASGAALAVPVAAQAVQYATLDEAARRAFPDATAFQPQLAQASADDMRAIAAVGGAPPRGNSWQMLRALKDNEPIGVVVADAVIGKFELIDYAVAIGSDGRVRAVEVLSYRESHGYEIKLPAWRKQFVGKGGDAKLRVGDDIANISGATLSCTHVTDGIRHVVTLVDRLRASGRL